MSFRFFGWFRKPTVAMIVAKHPDKKVDAIKEVRKVHKLGLEEAEAAVDLEDAYFFEEVVVVACAPQCLSIDEDEGLFGDFAALDDSYDDAAEELEVHDLEGDLCEWKETAEEAGSTEPSNFEPDEEWKEANAQANEEASEAASLEAAVAEAVAAYPDQKVAVIKHVRILTGLGLKEAKAAVDEGWDEPKEPTTIGDLIQRQMRNRVS